MENNGDRDVDQVPGEGSEGVGPEGLPGAPSEVTWPTRCPVCGSELASAVIDFDQSNLNRAELQPGEMVAVDYCPNPECPAKKPGSSE